MLKKLLGPGVNQCGCGYYLQDVNVFFKYSRGDCNGGGIWNVPADTVVWISVFPKPNPRLADLKLDETKFEKRTAGHLETVIQYVNEEAGLTLEVSDRMVRQFIYGPTGKDEPLRCR